MQVLAAFLKCIGHIIPLMDAVYANYYTREVMYILVREFQTPDEEMKKIVLKVVKQCVGTEGVEPEYIRTDILGPFFANFWVRRMALDRRNYRQLVETTVELANKVRLGARGGSCANGTAIACVWTEIEGCTLVHKRWLAHMLAVVSQSVRCASKL